MLFRSGGKKGKKGPGRAGGGPNRALPAGQPSALPPGAPPPAALPKGLGQLPQGFPPAPGRQQPPDPFGLRRPR